MLTDKEIRFLLTLLDSLTIKAADPQAQETAATVASIASKLRELQANAADL